MFESFQRMKGKVQRLDNFKIYKDSILYSTLLVKTSLILSLIDFPCKCPSIDFEKVSTYLCSILLAVTSLGRDELVFAVKMESQIFLKKCSAATVA